MHPNILYYQLTNSSRKGPISCLELEDIIKASNDSTIKEINKTQGEYYNNGENNFLVLPDEKTIVGVKDDDKTLQYEDITGSAGPTKIDNQGSCIDSLLFNAKLGCLLVGYSNGVAIQYKMDSNKTWEVQKNYGDLGAGGIFSCDFFGDIAVMDGGGKFKLTAINMKTQEVIGEALTTAIQYIYSLRFCKISDTKTLLVVSGRNPDYSNTTDIFDASELINGCDSPQTVSSPTVISPKINTSPKKLCFCDSTMVINTVLAKVEHYISEIFGKLVSKMDTQMRTAKRKSRKNRKSK